MFKDIFALISMLLTVAAGSGTSGTSLVPFYFESLEFFVLISNMLTMQKK